MLLRELVAVDESIFDAVSSIVLVEALVDVCVR